MFQVHCTYRYRADRLSVDQRFEFTVLVRISGVLNARSVIGKDQEDWIFTVSET